MNRIITIIFAALVAAVSTMAQSNKVEGETFIWEGGLTAGLNTDGWAIEGGVAYFPIQYLGLKLDIGVAGEIKEMGDWHFGDDDDDYYYDEPDDYTDRFKFRVAMALRSPRLFSWKSQNLDFYLFAAPGLVLSPGASGSKRAKTSCLDLKCGINMQIDRAVMSLGYGVSDFSLYSGWPVSHYGLPVNVDHTTHTVFAGISYKF